MLAWLTGRLGAWRDGWMDRGRERTKVIKAEGAWAPRLRTGLLQAMQGLKIGLWVPGAVGRDQDGHWSLGSRAVTSRKSCLLPPWLLCPGDGMGCAGSSSRSGAAWLGGPRLSFPARLPGLPSAVCSLLGKLQRHITRTIICAGICRDKEGTAYKHMYANAVYIVLCLVAMCYICSSTRYSHCVPR